MNGSTVKRRGKEKSVNANWSAMMLTGSTGMLVGDNGLGLGFEKWREGGCRGWGHLVVEGSGVSGDGNPQGQWV